MTKDPWADPRAQRWLAHVRHQVVPMIKKSAVSISIVPENPDAKMAVELGYSILLDKPIVIFCPPGREIPERLRRLADLVIEGELDDDARARLNAFMDALPE